MSKFKTTILSSAIFAMTAISLAETLNLASTNSSYSLKDVIVYNSNEYGIWSTMTSQNEVDFTKEMQKFCEGVQNSPNPPAYCSLTKDGTQAYRTTMYKSLNRINIKSQSYSGCVTEFYDHSGGLLGQAFTTKCQIKPITEGSLESAQLKFILANKSAIDKMN